MLSLSPVTLNLLQLSAFTTRDLNCHVSNLLLYNLVKLIKKNTHKAAVLQVKIFNITILLQTNFVALNMILLFYQSKIGKYDVTTPCQYEFLTVITYRADGYYGNCTGVLLKKQICMYSHKYFTY